MCAWLPTLRPAPPAAPAGRLLRPIPTEVAQTLAEEKANVKLRKEWTRARHRAPPGTDYQQIERANGLRASEARLARRRAPPVEDGAWIERGSVNQAGRMMIGRLLPDGTLYGGAASGGVWRQRPGGAWEPLGDNLYGGAAWLEVLPPDAIDGPPALIVGTDWGAIHRSGDDGLTWEIPAGLPAANELRRLLLAPDGQLYAALKSGGAWSIWRSSDQGRSFSRMFEVGSPPDLWTAPDRIGPLYLFADGVLSTSSDGLAWIPASGPAEGVTAAWLCGSVDDPDATGQPRLYLVGQHAGGTGTFVSDDGGANWERRADPPEFWSVLACAQEDRDLFAVGGVELHRSNDGARTFAAVNRWSDYYDDPASKLHADMMGLDTALSADGQESWLIATDGGLYRSDDGLATTQNLSLDGLRVGQYYSTLTSEAGALAAGAQDQGYQHSAGMTPDGDLFRLDQLLSGDYGHLTSGDGSHGYVFSTYPGFILVQIDEDRPRLDYLDYPAGAEPLWLPPVVADPADPAATFFLADQLWRYAPADRSWAPELWSELELDRGELLSALAFSPLDPDRAWAATTTGRLFRSDDHARTWAECVDRGPSSHYFYGTALIASRFNRDAAYVGGSGYDGPSIYRTTDGCATWEDFSQGLPQTLVYGLAEHPSGALAAGTEALAYRRDPGDTAWRDITGVEAPVLTYWAVEALAEAAADRPTFRFATYGRGVWDYAFTPATCAPGADLDLDGADCASDCDDLDPARAPGLPDACDATDQDCDPAGEQDGDQDGALACADCDDGDAISYPGGREICGDGRDNDCEGGDAACPTKRDPGCGCAALPTEGDPAAIAALAALALAYWRSRTTS